MSEEDINFLISIQDLEQPEFDNACLERENKRLNKEIERLKEENKKYNKWIESLNKDNHRLNDIIKEVREYIEKGIYSVDGSYVLKILDKEMIECYQNKKKKLKSV